MDIFSRIELHKEALTPSERAVYDIVTKDPGAVLGSTSTELAAHYDVSQSAISRFCQKVGYEGYGDFRISLHHSLANKPFAGEKDGVPIDPIECQCELLRATSSSLPRRRLDALARQVVQADNVYSLGSGQSSVPARMLSNLLPQSFVRTRYVEFGEDIDVLHCTTDRDLAFVFSSKNPTYRDFLTTASTTSQSHRLRTILVTHTASHPLKKLCDDAVVLPTWSSAGLPVYIEPMMSMITFCALLSTAVSHASADVD